MVNYNVLIRYILNVLFKLTHNILVRQGALLLNMSNRISH